MTESVRPDHLRLTTRVYEALNPELYARLASAPDGLRTRLLVDLANRALLGLPGDAAVAPAPAVDAAVAAASAAEPPAPKVTTLPAPTDDGLDRVRNAKLRMFGG